MDGSNLHFHKKSAYFLLLWRKRCPYITENYQMKSIKYLQKLGIPQLHPPFATLYRCIGVQFTILQIFVATLYGK